MNGLTQWRDCTSYSRDDKERVPKAYEIKHGYLRICITCEHIHHRPNWVLHCHAIGIDSKPIIVAGRKLNKDDDLGIVKLWAIEIVEARIDELNGWSNEPNTSYRLDRKHTRINVNCR
jgi:hypothetical protein